MRLGAPAVTARGLGEEQLGRIGEWLVDALQGAEDAARTESLAKQVEALSCRFPVPGLETARD